MSELLRGDKITNIEARRCVTMGSLGGIGAAQGSLQSYSFTAFFREISLA
jgi:hypothetical protein